MNTTSRVGWLSVIFLILTYYGFYATRTPPWSFNLSATATTPDLELTSLHFYQFDERGDVQQALHTPQVQRHAAQKSHWIKNPQIVLTPQAHQDTWHINAQEAIITQDGQHIQLQKQVILSNQAPKDQQVVMQADKASFHQDTHFGEYTGHVHIVQGETQIKADRASTQGNEQNHVIMAQMYGVAGQPVHYWGRTDPHREKIHAYADVMRFYPERHVVELIGHARLVQNNDSFSAPMITYDTKTQQMVTTPKKMARTRIVIHPEHFS